MNKLIAVGATASLVAASSFLGATSAVAAPGDPVAITVVHAIPGATVDVYVDAARIADDFTFDGAENPLGAELPAGETFQVRIVPGANAEGDFTGVLIDETLEIPDVEGVSLVAALDQQERPVLYVFEDFTSPLCTDEAELVLRHVAPIGAVDVFLDGELAIPGLEPGGEDGGVVPGGTTLDADVALAGEPIENAVISETLTLDEGTVTVVYAVGPETVLPLVLDVGTEACEEEPEEQLPVVDDSGDDAPAVPVAVPAGAIPAGTTTSTLVALVAALVVMTGLGMVALRRQV